MEMHLFLVVVLSMFSLEMSNSIPEPVSGSNVVLLVHVANVL